MKRPAILREEVHLGMELKPNKNESTMVTVCPICGDQAEQGCIYGADQSALRWLKGDPSFRKNLKAGFAVERSSENHLTSKDHTRKESVAAPVIALF